MTSTAPWIPFVNTRNDAAMVAKYYGEAAVVRIQVIQASRVVPSLPDKVARWVDAGLDAIGPSANIEDGFVDYLESHKAKALLEEDVQRYPAKNGIEPIVASMLDAALKLKPRWLTVPQTAMYDDGSRNRLNRMLAKCTAEWARRKQYHGGLVLPVIVTHPDQIRGKTQRNGRVKLARDCAALCGVHAVWVVDSSMDDQRVTGEHQRRYEAIIDFHRELRAALNSDTRLIAGPYWGLNGVLWARGLADFFAIGVGSGFHYFRSGGHRRPAKARVAIPPLRRTAGATGPLVSWLKRASKEKKEQGQPGHGELLALANDMNKYSQDAEQARWQVAKFYRGWLDHFVKSPEPGRQLALYQDFSAAYVFGAGLPDLPGEKGLARKPQRVAELLMLVTLATR